MELKGVFRSYKMYGYIYKIENLLNSKLYIGQSIDIKSRKRKHFRALSTGKHHNFHLQNSFNKYGADFFNFNILNWANSKEELDKLEVYFIKKYDTINREKGYNLQSGGSNGKPSDEIRIKLVENNPRYWLGKTGKQHFMYGRHLSKETKQKISESKKGKKQSEKDKQKRSDISPKYWLGKSWHGFKGCVYAHKESKPWKKVWRSSIRYHNHRKILGYFEDPLSAEILYKFVMNELKAVKAEKYNNIKEF